MTTDKDIMDRLASITASSMAEKQAVSDAFRPDSRPPFTEFIATVKINGIENRSGERQDGSEWSNEVVSVGLTKLEVQAWGRGRLVTELDGDFYLMDIPYSDRAKSQMGYTIAALASLAKEDVNILWADGKRIKFVEAVVPPPMDAQGNPRKDRSGYNMRPTFYYKAVEVLGGGQSNGSTPGYDIKGSTSRAAVDYAVGKTETEFYAGVLPYLADQGIQDVGLQTAIVGRKFFLDALNSGLLTKKDDKFVLI